MNYIHITPYHGAPTVTAGATVATVATVADLLYLTQAPEDSVVLFEIFKLQLLSQKGIFDQFY